MLTITFPNFETEKKALAFLLGKFSGRVLWGGRHVVPEGAVEALSVEGISFAVVRKTTYDELDYDDEEAVEMHILGHLKRFMTPFESQCYLLAIKREKAVNSRNQEFAGRFWREWESHGLAVRQAIDADFGTVQDRIVSRIMQDIADGKVALNRCPNCRRIPRTPLSMQCRWCRFDWHDG